MSKLSLAGRVALTQMNAICLVREERFRPPTIAGISRRDPATGKICGTTVYAQRNIQVRVGMRATAQVTEADGTVRPRQKTFGEKALLLSSTNEALRETLRTYASVEHEWGGLYTVLESVKRANKGRIPVTWASDREIEDFESTANSYAAVGPGSRHRFARPGIVSARITIGKARALIRKILEAWMNELIATAAVNPT
jgi:hypothetical protein